MVGPAATIVGLPRKKPGELNNKMLPWKPKNRIGMELSPVAVGMVERWHPQTHNLSTPNQIEWVKFALLTLTRRLGLPHAVAVVVLQSLKRSELGDGRAIEF